MNEIERDAMSDLIEEIEVREEMKKLPPMCSCWSYK